MLVQEQENVKRVKLADKYLSEAALGDANKDAIDSGNFYGELFFEPTNEPHYSGWAWHRPPQAIST